jgi:ABC-type glycerol-3-phosphate transport system permease component
MTTRVQTRYPGPGQLETADQRRTRMLLKSLRGLARALVSHAMINLVGLFFLVPFLWMLLTALKSNRDVSHTPPRWLPYDYIYVTVEGAKLPLYQVKTPQGERTLAAVSIEEGLGTFVDPQNPAQQFQFKMQVGAERIAEPLEKISFR